MKFAVISLFPEIISSYFSVGVLSSALKNNKISIQYYNPRDYSDSKHGHIDDKPFGGGSGMVLKPEPLIKAITAAKKELPDAKVVYLTPQGKVFVQSTANALINESNPLIFLSGRYEGIDQRVIDNYVDYEFSIGDYILSGGELPALVIMDAITRLLPNVLGGEESTNIESFSEKLSGLLEYPQYTRPALYNNLKVPEVLLNGNHQEIFRWRIKQSLGKTWLQRPNLLKCGILTNHEKLLLEEFKQEFLAKTDKSNL